MKFSFFQGFASSLRKMKTYDAIIIGGGGGLKLRPIANMGKKIAIVEKHALGGTCLNRGCIPSKMLIHTADIAEEIRNADRFDLNVNPLFSVNFETLIKRVSNFVDHESEQIAHLYEKNPNIDYYPYEAKFVDNKIVEVNGEKISAEKIFIATGSRPLIPEIEGLDGTPYWTSTDALRNTVQPKKMIIIGGGYIATELGHFFGALGTEVQFVVRGKMLPREDNDIGDEFYREFSSKYTIHLNTKIKKISYQDKIFTLTVQGEDGEDFQISADSLLVATGIVPNGDQLGLENTDIEKNEKGFIQVNDHLQTTVEGVYALGDVIGHYFFRHSVNFEGEYLLRTLYEQPSDEALLYPPMPHAVFSSPQIGGVGKTEDELKVEKTEYVVGLSYYKESAMGDALRSEYGLVKLLFDKKSRKLLGGHIVGKEASDMIHMLIAYMNMEATLENILNTIYVHPALPEVIRNAARKAKLLFQKILENEKNAVEVDEKL